MSDIYKAPEAKLTEEGEKGGYGSLEKGVAGDYTISIGEIIREAWRRTSGNKGKILLALLIYFIALAIINIAIIFILFSVSIAVNGRILALLYQALLIVANAPLMAGMWMIGIKLARDEQVSVLELFAHFDKLVPLAITSLLVAVLTYVGMLLLVIPGIYLAVAYFLAVPLVVDKKLGPWQALETSRKAITKHWFEVFGLLIVCLLLYIAGALPLLIGLIWVLPLLFIAFGIVYRNIFGGAED